MNQAYYKHVNMEFLGFPAYDTITFNLSQFFYEAADFIDKALKTGGKSWAIEPPNWVDRIGFIWIWIGQVIVHCHAGISRSATIVAAFLMIKRNMTAQEAIKVIRSSNWID